MNLYIFAGAAGIFSCFCNLRTKISSTARSDELYRNMSVLAKAEQSPFEAEQREAKEQQQHRAG